MRPGFSFCESTTAGPLTPWHIRQLTDAGRKLGGGIDSPTLCGRSMNGWDLKIPVAEHNLEQACRKCVAVYREMATAEEQG